MRKHIDAPEPKVAPAILQAKKIIEVNGWVRGALCTDAGYCVTGAIVAATTDMDVQDLAFEIVRKECGSKYVTQWNDHIARSKKGTYIHESIPSYATREQRGIGA